MPGFWPTRSEFIELASIASGLCDILHSFMQPP